MRTERRSVVWGAAQRCAALRGAAVRCAVPCDAAVRCPVLRSVARGRFATRLPLTLRARQKIVLEIRAARSRRHVVDRRLAAGVESELLTRRSFDQFALQSPAGHPRSGAVLCARRCAASRKNASTARTDGRVGGVGRWVGRSGVRRSISRSVGLSVDRSVGQFVRFCRSRCRSVGQSIGQSVVRSADLSVDRSVGRLIVDRDRPSAAVFTLSGTLLWSRVVVDRFKNR